jgi:hypothetical protein
VLEPGLQAVTAKIVIRAVKQAVSKKRNRFIAINLIKTKLNKMDIATAICYLLWQFAPTKSEQLFISDVNINKQTQIICHN